MKVCPVCKARVFDDMDTCYGCLYRFGSVDVQGESSEAFEPEEPPVRAVKPQKQKSAGEWIGGRAAAQAEKEAAHQKDARLLESLGQSVRDLVLHVPIPEGTTGVRISVDFAGCVSPGGDARPAKPDRG